MKPQDDYRNGDGGGGGAGSGSASGSDDEGSDGAEDELSLDDAGAPARALSALNALRKSRQHFDCVLVADGAEVPAHRAVLAAASPYLLEVLAATPPAGAGAPVALRVEGVDAEALRTLVEYAYTGRARVRESGAARRLYLAAWRLRVEAVRAHLAERLARRPLPQDCLARRALPDLEPHLLALLDAYIAGNHVRARASRRLYLAAWRLRVEAVRAHLAERLARRPLPQDCLARRALPDLEPHLLALLDKYIAGNFDEICEIGALATLPKINIEMLRESSAEDGEETAAAVAGAALAWLRDRQTADVDLEDLCSRTHLLFVDACGELRDCGELPASRDEAPELGEYRREAAERGKGRRRDAARQVSKDAKEPRQLELGARTAKAGAAGACCVIAVRAGVPGTTRALVLLRGRLCAVRVVWRLAGGAMARGGVLGGGARDAGERLAALACPRCAHGCAAHDGRIVVCGGYDRARVLRSTEAYDPLTNTWSALPDMRVQRARFPAARGRDTLFALGGSDGHADLDSVDAFRGTWTRVTRLPLARTHAAAVATEDKLFVIGGWAGGLSLKRVDSYNPDAPDSEAWTEAPPLNTGRSQCAGVLWENALWVLGGCDAWHCLASTETLKLDAPDAGWTTGPALPTARRSVGGAVWRGRLVSAGGSDGAASLRRTDWLLPAAAEWRAGPDLRRARAALGLAVLDDVLYAVGGFDGKEFLSCVERLTDPEQGWTSLWARPAALQGPRLSITLAETQEVQENGDGEPAQ